MLPVSVPGLRRELTADEERALRRRRFHAGHALVAAAVAAFILGVTCLVSVGPPSDWAPRPVPPWWYCTEEHHRRGDFVAAFRADQSPCGGVAWSRAVAGACVGSIGADDWTVCSDSVVVSTLAVHGLPPGARPYSWAPPYLRH